MNLPAKLLGLFLLGSGFLAYFRFRRALARGYTGPRHRRIHAADSPWRFKLAVAGNVVAFLICLAAAAMCLSHGFHH